MPTFAGYLAALPADQQAALAKLRHEVQAAAPEAVECVSYGLPSFRLDGKLLLALGAAKNHCALYLGATVQRHRAALRPYDVSKGTIRFPADAPPPAALIRRLVRARIAERR